jgi:signal peptidase I
MTGDEAPLRVAFNGEVATAEQVALRTPTGRFRPSQNPVKATAEWIVVILLAVSVALLVRHFVVQSYSIPSASMHPTLKVKDRLLVTKVNYQWADIKRGDVIVFKKPESMKATEGPGGIEDLVKRVIGLPGDTVEARDGSVFINGTKLDEPYLPAGTQTTNLRTIVVPVDEYFMMGDNRDISFDSRFWGTIKRSDVIGEVFFRFWPPGRVGRVD